MDRALRARMDFLLPDELRFLIIHLIGNWLTRIIHTAFNLDVRIEMEPLVVAIIKATLDIVSYLVPESTLG